VFSARVLSRELLRSEVGTVVSTVMQTVYASQCGFAFVVP